MPRGGGPQAPKRHETGGAREVLGRQQQSLTGLSSDVLDVVRDLAQSAGDIATVAPLTAQLLHLAESLTAADLAQLRPSIAAYVVGGIIRAHDADRLLQTLADLQVYREEQADAHAAPEVILVPLARIDGPWTSDEIASERSDMGSE